MLPRSVVAVESGLCDGFLDGLYQLPNCINVGAIAVLGTVD